MPATNPTELTIFISSPGDVEAERNVLRRVVERVDASLPGLSLKPYFSEDDIYFASRGPQEGIPLSSQFDLVVCLFWKRMGTRLLPQQFDAPDGRKRTGSEFEFETAVAAARETPADAPVPTPSVLAYRCTREVFYSAKKVDEERAQDEALKSAFARWIKDEEGHFLGYSYPFADSEELANMFAQHLRSWIAMRRGAADWDVAAKGSPFRGLDVFEREHADVYFGRGRAILEACARMKAGAEAGFPVLWLVGASGSGKSSLMRAGVAPRLERSEGGLCSLIFRPNELGTDLASGLAEKLLAALPELQRGSFPDVATLRSLLAVDDPTPAVHCLQTALNASAQAEAQRCGWSDTPRMRLLIGIDQAEELLTQRSDTERRHLVRLLQALLAADQVWLMLSFRSDFYALMQRDGDLTPLKATAQQLDIATPSAAEFAEMIEGPARAAGLTPQVRDELCADATGPDSLPMLQFALRALHEQAIARGDHVLRLSDYQAMGRAAGALSRAAEDILKNLPATVQAAFPRVLQQLVDLNLQTSSRAPTAQNAPLSHFADDSAAQALIAELVQRRLLTQFDVAGEQQLRVVHESLFKHWPRAQQRIAEDARRLDVRRRLIDSHALWRDADGKRAKNNRVLTGFALQEGLDLVRAWGLPDELRSFVRESQRAALRQRRNRKIGVAGLSVTILMALGMYWLAVSANADAQATRRQGAERALGRAQEQLLAGKHAEQAAYLAESLGHGEAPGVAMPVSVALQQLESVPLLRQFLHGAPVISARFSPDGKKVVTGSRDGTVRLWHVDKEADHALLLRDQGVVGSAQFDSSGQRIVSTSNHGTSEIWDVASGAALGWSLRHDRVITSAEFSGDGALVVTASDSGSAKVWDIATLTALGAPLIHEDEVTSVHFSSDAQRVVTASRDGTAQVWNARTGRALAPPLRLLGRVTRQRKFRGSTLALLGQRDGINSANFDVYGTRVVTASNDKTARIWDARSSVEQGAPLGHEGPVLYAEFSADGGRVVTASGDNTARIWNASTHAALGAPMRHSGPVVSAHFSNDGLRVVTASDDGTARVWDAMSGKPVSVPLRHGDKVSSAYFDSDATRVVTSSFDGTARVWYAAPGNALPATLRHMDQVTSAQFSIDGEHVATASWDGTAQIWDAHSGRAYGPPLQHNDWVNSARFNTDGTRVVTASDDGTAQEWDVVTGAKFGLPMQHGERVWSAEFSVDTISVLTVGVEGRAKIWSNNFEENGSVTLEHRERVISAHFSRDGTRIVTASWDHTAQVWNATTGEPFGLPLTHDDLVSSAQFSVDGSRVVTSSHDNTARTWGVDSRTDRGGPLTHSGKVRTANFSPDGSRVVTASSDGTARIWDVRSSAAIGAAMHHAGEVAIAEFSPDATRVVTGGEDNTARIWDASTGAAIGAPLLHGGWVRSVHFWRDGIRQVTASADGTARIWIMRPDIRAPATDLIRALQALAGLRVADDGRLVNLAAEEFLDWRRQMLTRDVGQSDFDRLVRWHLADRATRTVSPFSELTIPEHIEREIDWALAHPQRDLARPQYSRNILDEAYTLNPAHPLILFALSVFEDRPETKALWKRLSFPRIAHDARLAARAAEILQQDNDPENAKKAAEIALSLAPNDAKAKAVLAWAYGERQRLAR